MTAGALARQWLARCAGALLLGSAAASAAQAADTAAPGAAEFVKTGLYLLPGGGSNTLMRLSASGTVLVDGKLPGNYRALMAQTRRISKLSDLPVRVLFITDHHAHHSGNDEQFQAAGIAVVAQQNAKARLPESAAVAPGAKPMAPIVGFEREYTLKIGGVEMQALHFGPAHTDDDAVVYFRDLRVVAVGDLYTPEAPRPDFAGGGSLAGWGPVLEQVLKLDFDIAVPSVGAPLRRAELIAFKARIDTLTSRASALVKRGVPQDQFQAQLVTDDLGWQFSFSAEQLAGLYADLYADLSRPR